MLVFILLFKMFEQVIIGGVMGLFYWDMGFIKMQIGVIIKIYGIWIGIVGVFIGGVMVVCWGVWCLLVVMIVLCGVSNLFYLLLMQYQGSVLMFMLVIFGENFILGMLGLFMVVFLLLLVNCEYMVIQYVLFSLLVNLFGKVLGFFVGGIVMVVGYGGFFVIIVLGIVLVVLLFVLVCVCFCVCGFDVC